MLEDAGRRRVPGWATAISAGPPNESARRDFMVTQQQQRACSRRSRRSTPTGTLTYTPARERQRHRPRSRSRLQDNGGTANGGVDTSAPQTFTITVTRVNDAPSFTKGADQTVLEDAGAQTRRRAGRRHQRGPAERERPDADVLVTNNNERPVLGAAGVGATGTLTYTPAAERERHRRR